MGYRANENTGHGADVEVAHRSYNESGTRLEWRGIEACPRLGAVPACYVVGLGYSLMAVAVIFAPRRLTALFLLGWAPVFAMAFIGSTMEILGRPTCPVSPTGTPMCFYSLAVASTLLPVFWVSRRLAARATHENLEALT